MALEHMTRALKLIGKDRDKIAVHFVSVDPNRDTVDTLKLYSTNFDPNIIMLTGTEKSILDVMKKYYNDPLNSDQKVLKRSREF
jgi:protein SCO1/2